MPVFQGNIGMLKRFRSRMLLSENRVPLFRSMPWTPWSGFALNVSQFTGQIRHFFQTASPRALLSRAASPADNGTGWNRSKEARMALILPREQLCAHPPSLTPAYGSTVLRAPAWQLRQSSCDGMA